MRPRLAGLLTVVLCYVWHTVAVYLPLHEYAGATFFDGWDYWGDIDNTTWGNVTYLDRTNATTTRLTYVNDAGHAIVRVDNTTTILDAPLVHRESIRLTSKEAYGVGTVWIIDAVHIPYGCSVWPSFWTLGVGEQEWPANGEIDIIEGINMMNHNQIALHSRPGCMQAANPTQSGQTLERNCSLDRGCIVAENKPNSFGRGFAEAGGGVYAVQMDISGVFVWFWSRPDIPEGIKSATSTSHMDIATWGMPTASYPVSGCNITDFFTPQKLVLLTTLCGSWAGIPSLYSSTCPGSCINDNIIGPGSPKYDQAYWEVSYIRTYIAEDLAGSTPPGSSSSPTQPGSPTSQPINPVNPSQSSDSDSDSPTPTQSKPASAGTRTAVSMISVLLSFVVQLF
ncbi:concanavalin A-like lectin/glucanase domain-containing protein [Collybia nuda]|uniref:Concanavalin A-like lectin/glucanase domain-containing protein n=1 Tax=Collybia nuda TaxID=64659 RepID=A0A9P5Y9R9_9AGAR|nr:concanavalin A-like lectin/glucanase domain-containing protein [Collybia nuda]